MERYRGLVVHGPLIATLLLQELADIAGPNTLSHFAFSARSPAIAGDVMHLAVRATDDGFECAALNAAGTPLTQANARAKAQR